MLKGKPFVKWAGGKRQIIDKLLELVPYEFDTYYEPFIGWVGARKNLEETFNEFETLYNIDDLDNGILERLN